MKEKKDPIPDKVAKLFATYPPDVRKKAFKELARYDLELWFKVVAGFESVKVPPGLADRLAWESAGDK